MPQDRVRSPTRLLESAKPLDTHATKLVETRRPKSGNVTLRQEARGGQTVSVLEVTVAMIGRVNRNGRLYPRSTWEGAVAAAQDDLTNGKLWGLLEHPSDSWDDPDPMKGRLERVVVKYDKFWIEGDLVKAEGPVIRTHAGQNLEALVAGGVAVGVSSNGAGSVKYVKARDLNLEIGDLNPDTYIAVVQDDFRVLTLDLVGDPSDPAGTATRKESKMKYGAKVTKAAARLGMTVEAFAAAHPEWVTELQQEEAAPPVTPPAANPPVVTSPAATPTESANGTVDLAAYRALEQTVVKLQGDLGRLTDQAHNDRRDGIVATALEAARLPMAGKVKYGETELDLDASFRAEITTIARAAESDEAARTAIDAKIVERRAMLGQRATEARVTVENGVRLPNGNNAAPTQQESANSGAIKGRRGLGLL